MNSPAGMSPLPSSAWSVPALPSIHYSDSHLFGSSFPDSNVDPSAMCKTVSTQPGPTSLPKNCSSGLGGFQCGSGNTHSTPPHPNPLAQSVAQQTTGPRVSDSKFPTSFQLMAGRQHFCIRKKKQGAKRPPIPMQHREGSGPGWEDVPLDGQQALTSLLIHIPQKEQSEKKNAKAQKQPHIRLGTDLHDGFSYSSSKRAADHAISCFTPTVRRLTEARLLEEQK